jgi:hypothetical protein
VGACRKSLKLSQFTKIESATEEEEEEAPAAAAPPPSDSMVKDPDEESQTDEVRKIKQKKVLPDE